MSDWNVAGVTVGAVVSMVMPRAAEVLLLRVPLVETAVML